MPRFHLNNEGAVKICNAKTPKTCKFYSFCHYEDHATAIDRADKINDFKAKRASGSFKDIQEMYKEMPIEVMLEEVSKAKKVKLTNTDTSELQSCLSMIDRIRDAERDSGIDFNIRMYINKEDMPKETKENLNNILYLAMPECNTDGNPYKAIWETDHDYYVWTNNTKYHDIAIIKKRDNSVSYIEVKNLSEGAQIQQTRLKQDHSGKLISPSNNFVNDKIKDELSNYNAQESWRENKVINLTEKESLAAFVEMNKEDDVSRIMYTDKAGDVKTIWIKSLGKVRPTDDIVKNMQKENLSVELKIRNNNNEVSRVVNNADIKYFNDNYGHYFKDGKVPENGKFTVKDLVNDRSNDLYLFNGPSPTIRERKGTIGLTEEIPEEERDSRYLRIGEFRFAKKNFQIDDELDIREFKRFIPHITGEIKIKD